MTLVSTAARRALARHIVEVCFAGVSPIPRPNLPVVAAAVKQILEHGVSDADHEVLLGLAVEKDIGTVSAARRRRLLLVFGLPELLRRRALLPPDERRADPLQPPAAVLRAAVRVAVDPTHATAEDTTTLSQWVRTKGSATVAPTNDYEAESRGLPPGFLIDPFVEAVRARLGDLGGTVSDAFVAVVVGRLLLDGNLDPARSDFRWAVKRAYDQGVATSSRTPDVPNKTHYENIVKDLRSLRSGRSIRYQELAALADHVIASADEDWDITDRNSRRSQVEVGLMKYADGTVDTGFTGLDLPAIISEDASNQEIEPANVQAVAMVAAAYELEQTGAFDVVDKMVELFTQGMLPVKDDSGGRALNRYYWQAPDRLEASARSSQYARALGHGDSGRGDAQPNPQFDQLLMRFVSSLVRYDNALQVSNVVAMDGRERLGTSEQVRKAAQDLAANASLYGWGFTVFAARKLNRHVDNVFDVLGQETLQRAYGVTGPWQLVERVAAVELGFTPAIVQHRTRAKALKDLLDTIAVYSTELSRSGGVRRFLPNISDLRGETEGSTRSTVGLDDYEKLISAANNLIAVGGVTDDELARLSAPVVTPARGSIPVVGADFGTDGANLDQIRQLASQGQFDQLQRLLASGNGSMG